MATYDADDRLLDVWYPEPRLGSGECAAPETPTGTDAVRDGISWRSSLAFVIISGLAVAMSEC